jgi:hypothetical protein
VQAAKFLKKRRCGSIQLMLIRPDGIHKVRERLAAFRIPSGTTENILDDLRKA